MAYAIYAPWRGLAPERPQTAYAARVPDDRQWPLRAVHSRTPPLWTPNTPNQIQPLSTSLLRSSPLARGALGDWNYTLNRGGDDIERQGTVSGRQGVTREHAGNVSSRGRMHWISRVSGITTPRAGRRQLPMVRAVWTSWLSSAMAMRVRSPLAAPVWHSLERSRPLAVKWRRGSVAARAETAVYGVLAARGWAISD